MRGLCSFYLFAWSAAMLPISHAQNLSPESVKVAMDRAVGFARSIACHGGYLWSYTEGLQQRWGENEATATQIWVQPPGTPSVGMAYLRAYDVTREKTCLEAATDVGNALAWGQLGSGGWDYKIEFDPQWSGKWFYRRDAEAGEPVPGKRRNVSTLDDDNTQSALRFLMELDRRLGRENETIHRAALYGLESLLRAQYPCGAWPQRFTGPVDPKTPVLKAHYPAEWSRTFPMKGHDYSGFYTLNDDTLRDCIETCFLAHEIYGDGKYRDAAIKGGDFILLAQMPEPQPVWAQQYNLRMEPDWARKFEPPALTGGESAGVMRLLIELWVRTGEEKFLRPLPSALRWYRESRLANGKWARFYELQTNKPLYFVKDTYDMTYDNSNVPTHYSFQGNYGDSTIRYCEEMMKRPRESILEERKGTRTPAQWREHAKKLEGEVKNILASLDDQGRWVEKEKIEVATFNKNLTRLADYLEAVQRGGG